jgi:hypothetical protein
MRGASDARGGVIGPDDTPSDEDVRRFDKKRKDNSASNAD